ncbi:MAG: hypothetical protein WC763_04935 [Candidatus Paceibacterota bacterium]|jgi:hypothetical protein
MLKNKYLWIGVALGLVVGDLIGVSLFKAYTKPSSDDSVADVATTSPLFVSVASQAAGKSVFVSEARSSASSTWLAVREQNGDLLGQILGARRIDATSTGDVSIELLRPTVSHLMYSIVMYEDDGDGQFEYATDTLIKENGAPVSYPFVTY